MNKLPNVPGLGQGGGLPMPTMQVDLSMAVDVACHKCGSPDFRVITNLKKLSALVSPNGKDTIIQAQLLRCDRCGEELDFSKVVPMPHADLAEQAEQTEQPNADEDDNVVRFGDPDNY